MAQTDPMKKDTLVFDFDGTIADTLHHLVKISNNLSNQFNFKSIEDHEVDNLKDKTSQEIIKLLNVPILKIPMIVTKAKGELHKNMALVEPKEGLREILLHLKSLGHEIGILTSNSLENVMKFLKNNDLDFFDFINATSKIWSKNTQLNNLINNRGLNPENVVYIGDETRDIEAAKKAGVRMAAVTWGYNSEKALKAYNPDYLLKDPEELLELGIA